MRLGSIAAAIAWIGLLIAPGSRAENAEPTTSAAAIAAPETESIPSTSLTTTTVPVPTTVLIPPPTPAPNPPPPTATTKAPGPTAPRVLSVRDLIGVRIDRVTSWIAIATVTVVDQSGAPAVGVDVKASWSLGPTAVSCTTDINGKCSMYQSAIPIDLDVVTITLTTPHSATKSISRQGVN